MTSHLSKVGLCAARTPACNGGFSRRPATRVSPLHAEACSTSGPGHHRAILTLALLCCASLAAGADKPIRGFTTAGATAEHEWEAKALATPDPVRIGRYMRQMSQEPHQAGSPASKAVAEHALELLRGWGLDAKIEVFEALLPYPTSRALEMTAPVTYKAQLREPVVEADRNSGDAGQLPTYNAYSASGDVTAPLVYVNYGIPEDYDVLAKQGVDVKGKIVIARYGRSWRGTKPKVAAEHGAVGCLIYSDPRDDGYFQGDVYPKGAFRPPQGVQRGSVMDMPLYVGDPLSPGWASEPGSRRLALSEAKTIMKIPVLPISYGDAQPLLENLGGPVARESWRGALPITYHLGPGPSVVHLKLDFDWTTKPLYNVIVTIPGDTLADEWIIYGNHHDAWVNGTNDPVSGAAVVLETARTLSDLVKQGWKPRRTIKLALWDGEEFGLVGSTEWVEKHLAELDRKAAVYINSDTNGKGRIGAGGSPALQQFMSEVLRDLNDPVSGKSLLDTARESRGRGERPEPGGGQPDRSEPSNRGELAGSNEFRLGPLGAGSDYVAFFDHGGIASLNLGFSGSFGGVYHSIYDSWYWYTHFSDTDFVYGKALAQVMSTSLMRLADSSVLPFEFGAFSKAVGAYINEIRKLAGKEEARLRLDDVRAELDKVESAAIAYEAALSESLANLDAARLARLNQAVYRTERSLTLREGLPGREWYKHQISAPGVYTGYGAKTLPGVREAVEAKRWDEAERQSQQVIKVLRALTSQIDAATGLLRTR